jgi:hypothetical protein
MYRRDEGDDDDDNNNNNRCGDTCGKKGRAKGSRKGAKLQEFVQRHNECGMWNMVCLKL